MSIFFNESERLVSESKEVMEVLIIDELINTLTESELEEFKNSREVEMLVESGVISKGTIVRLSKEDDLSRRTKLAAMYLARSNDDPALRKILDLKKELRRYTNELVKRYQSEAKKQAVISQKKYFSKIPTLKKKRGK